MAKEILFAKAGGVFVLDSRDHKGNRIQQLLWGDEVEVLERADDWLRVMARREEGWLHVDSLTSERLLEINFVDVGQGDGAFLVTPDNELALVDAGEGSNMRRFLSWRFNLRLDRPSLAPDREQLENVNFKFALLSHGDKDHYGGFKYLFESQQLTFDHIYHNALVERPAKSRPQRLGRRGKVGGIECYLDLIESPEQLDALISAHPELDTEYLKLLASTANRFGSNTILGITAETGYLNGFDHHHKTAKGKNLSIKILGPIPLTQQNSRGLPKFEGDLGVSKNGHSIVLLIQYGELRFLLGGDLNTPSEEHLLREITKTEPPSSTDAALWEQYLADARQYFGADIAKSCHHGSADFSTTFLRAINAAATIISSGDEEPYCHPRPDTLGTIGRCSRGERPCIFTTELMRSSPEYKSMNQNSSERIKTLINELPGASEKRKKQISKEIDVLLTAKERIVATYGMISLRSDGERILIAQKLERPRAKGEEFDMHWFSIQSGTLTLDQ